jgi:hypothetical protein
VTSQSITELFRQLIRLGRSTEIEARESWYPSDIGKCDRQVVLKHSGFGGGEIDDRTARVFWLGDAIHHSLQIGMSALMPGEVWHEVEVLDTEAKVSGRIDTLYTGGPLQVFEYKSIKSLAFAHTLPKEENVDQCHFYLTFRPTCPKCCRAHDHRFPFPHSDVHCDSPGCDLCEFTGKLAIPETARLFYVSKDGAEDPLEFVIAGSTVSSEKVLAVISRLQGLYQKYEETGELPPPLAKVPKKVKGQIVTYLKSGPWGKKGDPQLVEDWRVAYCDYRGSGLCCGDDNGVTHHLKGQEDGEAVGETRPSEGS